METKRKKSPVGDPTVPTIIEVNLVPPAIEEETVFPESPPPEPTPPEIPLPSDSLPPGTEVGSLPDGKKFVYNEGLFLKQTTIKSKVTGMRLVKHAFSQTYIRSGSITLDPHTLVYLEK